MVTQEAQLGAQTFHLFDQFEHGFDHGQIQTVTGTHVFNAPNGVDRFFRKCHDAIRRLKNRTYKTGTAVDQN